MPPNDTHDVFSVNIAMNPISPYPPARLGRLTAILILLVVFPLLIVWGIVVYFDTGLSHKRAASANLTTARIIAKLVDKTFDDTFHHLSGHKEELIETLTANDQKELNGELKEILFASPTMAGIALYSHNGKGIAHLVMPGHLSHQTLICPKSPSMDFSKEQWFRDYKNANKQPTITNLFVDPCEPKVPHAAAIFPLRENGRLLGVLRATYDIPTIKSWFKPLKLPAGVKIALLDGNGRVIFDSNPQPRTVESVLRGHSPDLDRHPIFSDLNRKRSRVGIYYNPNIKQTEIAAYAPIKGRSWGALVRQPLSVVDAPIRAHIFQFSLAIFGLLLLGLGLTASILRSYAREGGLSQKLYNTLNEESKLRSELAKKVQELTIINDITQDISQGLEVERLLESATKNVVGLMGADASLCLISKAGDLSIQAVAFNLPKECIDEARAFPPLFRDILDSGKAVIIDGPRDANAKGLAAFSRMGITSGVFVPIFVARKPTGVLSTLSFSDSRRKFTEHDIRLLQSVGREVGIALENAFLHEQTVNIAMTLQRSLLPPKNPRFPGFAFGACYKSATTQALIGGDFYDLFDLEGDRLAIVIGDVAGHGVQAASLTALAKTTIRAFALEEASPRSIATRANKLISQSIEKDQFITAFIAILETSGKLTYVNCGHTTPLIFRSPDQIIALEQRALPLGLSEIFTCADEESVFLRPNDLLLLYTDGVTEARRFREFFGEQGVIYFLRNNAFLHAARIPDELCQTVEEFCGATLVDDLAIISIKREGDPPIAKKSEPTPIPRAMRE